MDTRNRHFHAGGDTGGQDVLLQLQDLLAGNTDVQEFLSEVSRVAAEKLSTPGTRISCGVTVIRRKKPLTIACSDSRARTLDDLQNSYGDGPCLTVLREGTRVYVPDVLSEHRWPDYLSTSAESGVSSILAVPMDVENTGQAVLNLYSPRVHGFSETSILAAEAVAGEASRALRLALKIAQLNEVRDNLSAALESRTTVATAIGVTMAENRCTRERAFQLLVEASNHQNMKMRSVAQSVIDQVTGNGDRAPGFGE
jgi:GAF domain-containing protein